MRSLLQDKVHEMLSDRAKLEKLSEDKDLVEALEPEAKPHGGGGYL